MKSLLNPITTQKMAILQNPVRRLQMIIFSWSYGACHQSGNLQLLGWNAYLTKFYTEKMANMQNHRF